MFECVEEGGIDAFRDAGGAQSTSSCIPKK